MATATHTPSLAFDATQSPTTRLATTPHAPDVERWPLTVEDYHRLVEVGVFSQEDALELIEGDVFILSPLRCRHAACVRRLDDRLRERLGRRAIVSVQCPVRMGANSEPEPDLALLRSRADYYAEGHPEPSDVLLLIEVIDTTADLDRGVKLALYARAGVAEVWLVDLKRDRIEAHRRPLDDFFSETRILPRGQSIAPQAFPDLKLSVDAILG